MERRPPQGASGFVLSSSNQSNLKPNATGSASLILHSPFCWGKAALLCTLFLFFLHQV